VTEGLSLLDASADLDAQVASVEARLETGT
jgi:hypothetical protein